MYDVVVVGGGAAGLSGALALGRSCRSVLVLDAGEPRNAPAGHMHNYLGRESTSPRELLADGRREVEEYGVEVATARVATIRAWDRPGIGFVVTPEEGREVLARRLLVATGVADELPAVPGLKERWGRDVLHCAYCHGWEVRDQAIAVIATNALAVHHAMLFRQLSDDVVVVLAEGTEPPAAEDLERLAVRGVEVLDDAPVEVLVGDESGDETGDGVLRGVRLASGAVLERDALVVSPVVHARADFLAGLGLHAVPFEMGAHVLGTCLPAEPTGATAVPGVWAAGNLVDPMAQVIASAAGGLRAGATINADLAQEDAQTALDTHRAEFEALLEQPG